MNTTPWGWANPAPTSRPAASASSRPALRTAQAKGAPTSRPSAPTTRRQPTKAKMVRVDCRNRLRYGRYCLGRVIGPKFSHQIVRCPHCGKAVRVKRLDKPWAPASYDSDLRPYFGHYQQKDRIWLCRHCGYAAYAEDFFKKYNKRNMTDALRSVRRTFPSYKNIPGSYRYLAANAAYVARGRGPVFFAKLLVRAMWAAREGKEAKYVKSFRRGAILALRLSFKRKKVPALEQHLLAFQLADLLRQEGQWLEATFWLERAYSSLQQAKKAAAKRNGKKVPFARQMGRWLPQVQERIGKRDKKVFRLDG